MRRFTAIAAALLAAVPGIAQAAAPCLTPREFASLAGYTLPSIITGTTQRCATTLGNESFLRQSGAQLSARYAARKATEWPGAKSAFIKLSSSNDTSGASKLIAGMPDASLQQMLDGMMAGMIGQQIPLDRCGTIDNVIRLLSPLPPQNTAELIAVVVGLTSKSGTNKVGPINLCQA